MQQQCKWEMCVCVGAGVTQAVASSYLVCLCESGLGERPETFHLQLHLTNRRVKADAATSTQTTEPSWSERICTCRMSDQLRDSQQQQQQQKKKHKLVVSAVVAGAPLLLTFAEVDRHALGLEQAVVLRVALGLRWRLGRWGLRQRVRQGGRRCSGGRRWWGGGRGWVYLAVDRRNATGADRDGRSNELPAEV